MFGYIVRNKELHERVTLEKLIIAQLATKFTNLLGPHSQTSEPDLHLSHINPADKLTYCFYHNDFNIFLPSRSRYPRLPLEITNKTNN
jgi:hypothetical protein